MTTPLVTLDGLGVAIGRTRILADVSLQLDPGQSLGVHGPNGSGKSTLLSVLATFIAPTEGSGTVLGADLTTGVTSDVRRRIRWIGHDPGLYPHLTLLENLQIEAAARNVGVGEAAHALEIVGLSGASGRRADQCSNGMQRRTDLARAFIDRPTLLLLDEADAGLDDPAGAIVDRLIETTRGAEGAVVMVTHDPARLGARVDAIRALESGHLE